MRRREAGSTIESVKPTLVHSLEIQHSGYLTFVSLAHKQSDMDKLVESFRELAKALRS